MNTVKSFWLGWGSLCAAGGVAYVFAKRSINEDRQARMNEQRRRRALADSYEQGGAGSVPAPPSNGSPARTDTAGSPSQESSADPAPTRHAPATEAQRVLEKGKYEASVPFKSVKGDRFS